MNKLYTTENGYLTVDISKIIALVDKASSDEYYTEVFLSTGQSLVPHYYDDFEDQQNEFIELLTAWEKYNDLSQVPTSTKIINKPKFL